MKLPLLRRYWFEFSLALRPLGSRYGVTAYSLEDAREILRRQLLPDQHDLPRPTHRG